MSRPKDVVVEMDDLGSGGKVEVVKPKPVLRIFCFRLDSFSPSHQFTILALGTFFFFIVASYVEEYTFRNLPEFEYGWYLTFFELVCFSCFAVAERVARSEEIFARKVSIKGHFTVAAAMFASRGLTNVSLQYLNYPTQIIFKSMKLITVMIGSIIILKRKYHVLQYYASAMMVISAILFSLGDVDTTPNYDPTGIIIVTISLVCDALHSNTQDRLLTLSSINEVLLFTNLLAAGLTLTYVIGVGQLGPALQYCQEQPIAYFLFIARNVVMYAGITCFVALMKTFGVVIATTVTTVRKILTICISFILFPKPLSIKYLMGFVIFCVSIWTQIQAKKKDMAAKSQAASSSSSSSSSSASEPSSSSPSTKPGADMETESPLLEEDTGAHTRRTHSASGDSTGDAADQNV